MKKKLFCTSCSTETEISIKIYPVHKVCQNCNLGFSIRKSIIGNKLYIKREDGLHLTVGGRVRQ